MEMQWVNLLSGLAPLALTPPDNMDNLRKLVPTIAQPLYHRGVAVFDAILPCLGDLGAGTGPAPFWLILAALSVCTTLGLVVLCWARPAIPLRALIWLITHTSSTWPPKGLKSGAMPFTSRSNSPSITRRPARS